MADRDVTLDIVARDKTGPAVRSTNRNLKSVEKSWRDVDGQGKKTLAAAQHIAGQWGRGLSKISGSASRWAKSGDGAGKKFVRGLFSGVSKLGELGASIGGGLSKAVSAAGPYVQVAVAALLVGAVVAAAPAIAGALVGGAAGVGIVGGLMLAAKDARVASAFDGLKTEVSTQLTDAAKSFVPASLSAVKEARSAFKGMLPDLKRLFDASSGFVAPLTKSLGKAASLMLSGITKAVEKAGPVMKGIGDGFVMVGRAVGEAFAGLSDNGASMGLALKTVFALVAWNIQIAGAALNLLVEAFEFFLNKIPGAKKWLDDMSKSQDGAKGSANGLATGFQLLGSGANAAAAGISNAKEKADEFADNNISLSNAQIAAREAVRSTTQAIIDNAKAKVSNSEKADRNRTALNNLASAFNTETTAGDKSGISAGKAAAAYATNRAALVAMAIKAGFSKTKAEELASTLLKQPKNVNTDVNVNTATASTKLETFQKKVTNLKGKTVYVTVQVKSNGDHYIPGVGTQVRRWGGIDYAMARGGALAAHFTRSPTVLYGERETGGEAFIPRKGDRGRSRRIAETVVRDWLGGDVFWAGRGDASPAAAGAPAAPSGGGQPLVLEAHIEIGGEVVRVVRTELKAHDRGLKRRVSAGSGRS